MKPSAVWIIIPTFILVSLSILSCAPPHARPPSMPQEPLTKDNLIAILARQEERVDSFISTGRIGLKESGQITRAAILFAGEKDPFRLKIEISHLWGRPIAHLLVDEKGFELLSFPEKRHYAGTLNKLPSLTLFPDFPGADQIWGLGRGFPKFADGIKSISLHQSEILLINDGEKIVQEIRFSYHDKLPEQVTYPEPGIRVSYSHFMNDNGILYAETLLITDKKTKTEIPLQFSQFVFNENIPEDIFHIIRPKNFEYVFLND